MKNVTNGVIKRNRFGALTASSRF